MSTENKQQPTTTKLPTTTKVLLWVAVLAEPNPEPYHSTNPIKTKTVWKLSKNTQPNKGHHPSNLYYGIANPVTPPPTLKYLALSNKPTGKPTTKNKKKNKCISCDYRCPPLRRRWTSASIARRWSIDHCFLLYMGVLMMTLDMHASEERGNILPKFRWISTSLSNSIGRRI